MAIEDELHSCPACVGIGMKGGTVCPECRGRGIVRVSHAIVELPEDDDEPEPPRPLENMSKAQLVEVAAGLGLDTTGKRDELIERIQTGPLAPPAADAPEAFASDDSEVSAEDVPVDDDTSTPAADGLDDLTVAELRERLAAVGLDATGRKADLIERLRAG